MYQYAKMLFVCKKKHRSLKKYLMNKSKHTFYSAMVAMSCVAHVKIYMVSNLNA